MEGSVPVDAWPGTLCIAANVNKGKQQQRDRRKLREKRRSTGVVHMPSTESTGGSTGEDEELLSITSDSKRNPISNSSLDGALVHHSPGYNQIEHTKHKKLHSHPRNKSPSDLEADDEDNQDYDSLTLSDLALSQGPALRAVKTGFSAKLPSMVTGAGHHHQHRPLPHTSSKYDLLKHSQPMPPAALVRGATYCSGVCTRGGQVLYGAVAGLQLTANRPSNGRPATPSSESSEELLERAREENRRLLQLLAEREQRITALEGRLAMVGAGGRTTRSFDAPTSLLCGEGEEGQQAVALTNTVTSSSNSCCSVVTSGSSNSSSTNVSSSVNNGLEQHSTLVSQTITSLTTE